MAFTGLNEDDQHGRCKESQAFCKAKGVRDGRALDVHAAGFPRSFHELILCNRLQSPASPATCARSKCWKAGSRPGVWVAVSQGTADLSECGLSTASCDALKHAEFASSP